MRRLLPASASALATLAAITLVGPGLAGPGPRSDSHNPAVIELFTSQGCSSCPAADALLGQLAERPGFVALSYSVDYWDYLGWRDTLGSPANSERQRDYAKARGDGRVYTPQAVVDGVTHANGSDEDAIQAAVAAASVRLAQVKVPVSMHGEGDTLVIDVGAAPETSDQRSATIWLAIAKEVEKVVVARGENRGRELSYHHPVRELTPIGMWHGEAVTLRLPLKDLETMGGDCLFALLQVEDSGPILGAAEFEPH
ncbi:MAG: DUF1223 domain-containing protein [Methyloceanibacter sp.]